MILLCIDVSCISWIAPLSVLRLNRMQARRFMAVMRTAQAE